MQCMFPFLVFSFEFIYSFLLNVNPTFIIPFFLQSCLAIYIYIYIIFQSKFKPKQFLEVVPVSYLTYPSATQSTDHMEGLL